MKDKLENSTEELAARHYQPGDYEKDDQLSSGLATTHEQVSDSYMEGEIAAPFNNKTKTKNVESSNEGYQDYYS
ncbi:YozQ family protein [Fredinandcohnia sp. QZ13]|uniref:YozQ family protein n=1 Tax=Fredinandcohnia sp. QZ13 TaxID=3073144 RepID=UPI0028532F59|nr:YozQ family protein [Fredinandcohnia sp. QZ13]MDR4887235.1 YozQ family protein [Fredinandcohnia sp. QZ13]